MSIFMGGLEGGGCGSSVRGRVKPRGSARSNSHIISKRTTARIRKWDNLSEEEKAKVIAESPILKWDLTKTLLKKAEKQMKSGLKLLEEAKMTFAMILLVKPKNKKALRLLKMTCSDKEAKRLIRIASRRAGKQ